MSAPFSKRYRMMAVYAGGERRKFGIHHYHLGDAIENAGHYIAAYSSVGVVAVEFDEEVEGGYVLVARLSLEYFD